MKRQKHRPLWLLAGIKPLAFGSGATIGTLGGLIGLGGAEFRLPLLISLFRFRGLEAVILNKAISLHCLAKYEIQLDENGPSNKPV